MALDKWAKAENGIQVKISLKVALGVVPDGVGHLHSMSRMLFSKPHRQLPLPPAAFPPTVSPARRLPPRRPTLCHCTASSAHQRQPCTCASLACAGLHPLASLRPLRCPAGAHPWHVCSMCAAQQHKRMLQGNNKEAAREAAQRPARVLLVSNSGKRAAGPAHLLHVVGPKIAGPVSCAPPP